MRSRIQAALASHLALLSLLVVGQRAQGQSFDPPVGGWTYVFEGDSADAGSGGFTALDGTWSHDNGSDEWDGSEIGSGSPGGVSALTSAEVPSFLRIQETGDPRDHGFTDPGSTRKIYLGHDITADGATPNVMDQGITLSFRARVPTTQAPLDDAHPAGGATTSLWPATGDGYVTHDGGKSNFSVKQADGGVISFGLAADPEVADFGLDAGGLVMNNLNGTEISGDVDIQGGDAGEVNLLPIGVTDWHEYWVVISGGGAGTHQIDVYLDGSDTPTSFDVTAGTGNDFGELGYIAMGAGATPQSGALDIDFFAYRLEAVQPDLVPGDVNDDELVDRADFDIISANFGQTPAEKSDGDLNRNNLVELLDFRFWKNNVPALSQAGSAAVPEPSAIYLALGASLALVGIGRRRVRQRLG